MPNTKKVNPRLLKKGDMVRVDLPQGGQQEELVRDLSLVLHLANGSDVRVPIDEDITTVLIPDPADKLAEQVAAMKKE